MDRLLSAIAALGIVGLAGPALAQQAIDYAYDRLGRLVRMADGAFVVTYTYDPGGNLLERGVVADGDGDRVGDDEDVCPAWPDPEQTDSDGNGIGNACECGDVSDEGEVGILDVVYLARFGQALPGAELPAPEKCHVTTGAACDLVQLLALRQYLAGSAPREMLCEAATGKPPGT